MSYGPQCTLPAQLYAMPSLGQAPRPAYTVTRGSTTEVMLIGVSLVGALAIVIMYSRLKRRLWEQAVPDSDERFLARLVTGF